MNAIKAELEKLERHCPFQPTIALSPPDEPQGFGGTGNAQGAFANAMTPSSPVLGTKQSGVLVRLRFLGFSRTFSGCFTHLVSFRGENDLTRDLRHWCAAIAVTANQNAVNERIHYETGKSQL